MDLILVTKTPIIQKIFSLVCNKLNINLEVKSVLNINSKTDIIVLDEEFVNDQFNNIKQNTKKLGAIVSEELPFDKSRDFILNRPFLPNKLEELLKEQCEYIKDEEDNEKEILTGKKEEEIITNYVESLADDVAHDIEEGNDESIVSFASLNDGGVLDDLELNKISDILRDEEIENEIIVDENDWKDISEIIDDALNEVKEYEFDFEERDKPIKLILNNYNIEELRPFLQKFNQGVIDRLSSGEDVDVTLCLKVNE